MNGHGKCCVFEGGSLLIVEVICKDKGGGVKSVVMVQ